MKHARGPAPDLFARFFLAWALFCPTALIVAKTHDPALAIKLTLWGLLASIAPVFLPRRGGLVCSITLWLISPLILALLAYISLNGIAPQPIIIVTLMQEADRTETASAIKMLFASGLYRMWATAYVVLISAGTICAFKARFSENRVSPRLRQNILCLCLLPLVVGMWWPLLDDHAPAWLPNTRDAQTTVIGEFAAIALEPFQNNYIRAAVNGEGNHGAAHEAATLTAPALSILIIGESMRADAFNPSVGARDPWSKELGARMAAHLAALLPPACAGHDSTALSVPMLITGTPPDQQPKAFTAPTGLSRLQSAGYSVGWLASSIQLGFAGPEVSPGHGLFWNAIRDSSAYDDGLLPVAESFIAPLMDNDYTGPPKALVLHIAGSHFNYEDRYPADLFGPEPVGLSAEEIDSLRYERANLYTARFIGKVAAMLDEVKVPAFAVYTSDHGENLIRDHNGLLRHVSPRSSLPAYMVPVFVMWNKAEQETGMPEKILASVASAQRLAQTDTYHIWMSLSGLDGGKAVEPTANPTVFGALNLGDNFAPVSCAQLKP